MFGYHLKLAWVSLRSLVEPEVLDVALGTAKAVLASPRFDADAIERVRQQMQIGLRRSLQSPASVAKRRFFETLYSDHPYAHSPGGSETSLAEIRRGDLERFHNRYYVAANAVVAIVGAVDRETAVTIAERVTAGLSKGSHAPALPAPRLVAALGAPGCESAPNSRSGPPPAPAARPRRHPSTSRRSSPCARAPPPRPPPRLPAGWSDRS